MSPFDLRFDNTFQFLIPEAGDVAVDSCRLPGVLLAWLSPTGWAYYLFSGNSDEDVETKSVGSFQQGGLDRDTQKISRDVLTLRAGDLSEADSRVVKTIYEANSVYALLPVGSKMQPVPVHIQEGTFAVYREANSRMAVEVKIVFPHRKSQRA